MAEPVKCIICDQEYFIPEPKDLVRSGKHVWTCSDECQDKFVLRGGLGKREKEEEHK